MAKKSAKKTAKKRAVEANPKPKIPRPGTGTIRLRRSSDDLIETFSMTPDGSFDHAAIAAWAQGSPVYVVASTGFTTPPYAYDQQPQLIIKTV